MLFEPTNITPSTISFTGTVASNDSINIQWQINGNSALTAFQIDVYQNDAYSTFLYSTGVLKDGCPFNGKNNRGEYVQFLYVPVDSGQQRVLTWSDWGLVDGNTYKYKITQFFTANNTVVQKTISQTLSENGKYYFSFTNGGTMQYAYFAVADSAPFANNPTLNYSITNSEGWVLTSSNRIVPITMGISDSVPSGYTQLSGDGATVNTAYGEDFTVQNSFSAIVMRTRPSLAFNPESITVNVSTASFEAYYSQAQGDNIRWVRWELVELEEPENLNESNMTILEDTGEIYTFVLQYQYNGFINGRNYAVRCTVETENGVQATTGWDEFTVSYTENIYTGQFVTECIKRDDCVLLSWDSISVFPAQVSPDQNSYTTEEGLLTLDSFATITWSQRYTSGDNPVSISFVAPWTVTWNGEVFDTVTEVGVLNQLRERPVANDAVFDETGEYLFVAGGNSETPDVGYVSVYTMSNNINVLTYPNIISAPQGNYETIALSRTNLFVGSQTAGSALYYLPNGVPTFLQEITFPSGNSIPCESAAFSPEGDLLVIGTSVADELYNYIIAYSFLSVGGGAEPSLGNAIAVDGLNGPVQKIAFNPHGGSATFAGRFSGKVKVYSVNEGTFTYVSDVQINSTIPDIHINSIAYNPNGTRLILGGYRESIGETAGVAFVFSVDGTTITYLYDLVIDGQTTFNGAITDVRFSPDGSLIVVSGFTGNVIKVLYFEQAASSGSDTLIDLQDVSASTADNGIVNKAIFSPNTSLLVAIGSMSEKGIQYRIRASSRVFALNAGLQTELVVQKIGNRISLLQNGASLGMVQQGENIDQIIYALTPTVLNVYQFSNGFLVGEPAQINLSYEQQPINTATLYGYQLCNSFVIYDGDGLDVLPFLANPDFEPTRQSTEYTIDLLANFEAGLEGGTGTSVGEGFRIYRTENGGSELKEIAYVPATVTEVKDYGIKSGTTYQYSFYAYDANGAFMGVIESAPITTAFDQYTLLATRYNENDGHYHVVKSYRFYANIAAMSVSNNNTPEFALNYTRYPTRFRSSANYASGTLEGLIGDVSAAHSEYYDSPDLITELNELSTSDYTLFLKDMKGFLRLVTVGSAITQTSAINTLAQQTTISLPWTEISDARTVSVIQTPEDEGWNYDDMVLDVALDVNVYTGELSVEYPPAYYGTTFEMVIERDLNANTPCGITPADLYLSPVAEESNDGELVATILRDETD